MSQGRARGRRSKSKPTLNRKGRRRKKKFLNTVSHLFSAASLRRRPHIFASPPPPSPASPFLPVSRKEQGTREGKAALGSIYHMYGATAIHAFAVGMPPPPPPSPQACKRERMYRRRLPRWPPPRRPPLRQPPLPCRRRRGEKRALFPSLRSLPCMLSPKAEEEEEGGGRTIQAAFFSRGEGFPRRRGTRLSSRRAPNRNLSAGKRIILRSIPGRVLWRIPPPSRATLCF